MLWLPQPIRNTARGKHIFLSVLAWVTIFALKCCCTSERFPCARSWMFCNRSFCLVTSGIRFAFFLQRCARVPCFSSHKVQTRILFGGENRMSTLWGGQISTKVKPGKRQQKHQQEFKTKSFPVWQAWNQFLSVFTGYIFLPLGLFISVMGLLDYLLSFRQSVWVVHQKHLWLERQELCLNPSVVKSFNFFFT